MKKNQIFLKRIVSLGLAVCIIAGLTSCGVKKDDTNKNEVKKEVGVNSKGLNGQHFNDDGTMKLPIINEEKTYKVLWRKAASDISKTQDKEILKNAQDKTGIKLDIEETPEAGWNEKISVLFAASQLPDVIMGPINPTSFINYVDQCKDITDLLPMYAPYMSNYLFNENPDIGQAEAIDGKIYSLPQARLNGVSTFEGWSINKEWLKNVGKEIPTTLDQLYDVLKAFKTQDANGNGDPSDEIPLSFVGVNEQNKNTSITRFMSSFGLVNDGVLRADQNIMVEDGKVEFTPTHERYREMLEYIHKLYADGLIDTDGFVQKPADRNAKGAQNRLGVIISGGELTEPVGSELLSKYQYILPMKGKNDIIIKQNLPAGEVGLHTFTISAKCKEPENLVMFLEYCNSSFENRIASFYGPEGNAWKYDANKMLEQVNDFTGSPYKNVQEARSSSGTNYNMATMLNKEDELRRLYTGSLGIYMEKGTKTYKPYVYDETFPQGSDTAEATAKRAEMFAEIDPYIQSFTTEAIMRGMDDAKWKSHLDKCNKLKVDEYVAGFQDLYKRLKK
jgi:putative aldouronate transport system substrate-binding protein